jgi:hypothetical protein
VHVDVFHAAVKSQGETAMHQTFPSHAFTDPGGAKKVHGALLEDTGPNPAENMVTTLTFQYNRINSMEK